jgi:peroxiredoxin
MKLCLSRILLVIAAAAVVLSGCAGLGTKAPRPEPDISFKLTDGREVSLASLRGKPLVIGVGATWCPHCMHEAPIFGKAYARYKGRINMLGIIAKSPPKDADALVSKNKLDFMITLDPDGSIVKELGVTGYPSSFFINSEGYIVDDNFGGLEEGELYEKIDELLKEK